VRWEDKIAMRRNRGERRLGPRKKLEGAGGGRQRRKRIVTTPAEQRAKEHRKTRSTRKLNKGQR
jgi:hypothetical protein